MDLFDYPIAVLLIFALIGLVVILVVKEISAGLLQAIGNDLWEWIKRKRD